MMKAREGHIVNTSSVNGFWASIGPGRPHTAYSAAKFAVKGFTEALITDLAMNAPHIKCSVVMPGHIGTDIVANSRRILGGDIGGMREQMVRMNPELAKVSDEQIQALMDQMAKGFHDNAPTTAAQAATVILDGVRTDKWRILVGKDAEFLDQRVRAAPETAYSAEFYDALVKGTDWRI